MKQFLRFQQDEVDSFEIYWTLGKHAKNAENAKILTEIAYVEQEHAEFIKQYTHQDLNANQWKTIAYRVLTAIFGLTFMLKIMESGESIAGSTYKRYPELASFSNDEEEHEKQLLQLINEKRLSYIGSIVLGLNDALVEFTGALAGFTLALSNTKLIALTASITAIAGALSMGSSEYLANKAEKDNDKHPLLAAFYTALAFFLTVLALIAPFALLPTPIHALIITLIIAVLIIALFNFYYATVRGESFKRRFAEMAIISFSIAGVSFLLGYLLKTFTGIDA